MNAVLLTQLILLVVAFGGWFLGKGIHASLDKRAEDSGRYHAELPRMSDTIAFISGAVGILLGLLLSFSVGSYQDTQNSIKEYGSSVTSAYRTTAMYPESSRVVIERDLVCSVNAFVENDWGTSVESSAISHDQASLWMNQLNTDVKALPVDTTIESQTFPVLLQSTLDMSHWRELIMLNSLQSIPVVIWVVIYVSVAVLAMLLALHLADRRGLGYLSFGAAYVTLAVIIYALTVLDYPMDNFGFGPTINSNTLIEMVRSAVPRFAQAIHTVCQPLNPALFTN